LTSSAEFQALFQQGQRIDQPSVVVLWRVTGRPRRVGFAVARQVGDAVHRNRARRRLREAYRTARSAAPEGIDVIVIGKRRAVEEDLARLTSELRRAFGEIARRTERP
jgi:ribonuclease P protein component